MKVEVLHAGGCANCVTQLDKLRTAAQDVDPAVDWRELDILQAINYAVELGVLTSHLPWRSKANWCSRRFPVRNNWPRR